VRVEQLPDALKVPGQAARSVWLPQTITDDCASRDQAAPLADHYSNDKRPRARASCANG
jgi:hypothetical protein